MSTTLLMTPIVWARAVGASFSPRARLDLLNALERGALAEAFSEFLNTGTATADQMGFVELVIEHLTHEGVMDPKLLYESPFTDVAPAGPEQVFSLERTDKLIHVIEDLNASAVA